MAYIGVQRQTDSSLFVPGDYTIANGAAIDFNTNLDYFGGTDTTVTYNDNTFTFTFTSAGYYYVDWFVVLESAFSTSGPTFTLVEKLIPEQLFIRLPAVLKQELYQAVL